MSRRWSALAVAVLAVLSACSSGGDDDALPDGTTTTRPPTSTTSTSTTTSAVADDDVTARYKAFWDARFAANEEPVDPDAPELREYSTGAQLDNVIAETTRNRDEGLAFRHPENSVYERRVQVIEVEGDTAHLQDCVTSDGIVYRVATGEVVDDSVATQSIDVQMRLVDGKWKVESAQLLQSWDGVAGCALAG
jgi:hypothetical protein